MNVLISGGLGFIGSNLIELIIENKFFNKVYILDNNSISIKKKYIPYEKYENIILINHDISKYIDYDIDLDCIIHLAAKGNVIESINDPFNNLDINVKGTLNILEFARKKGISKFIFSSTGGALMGNARLPVNESTIPMPISPYGASKLSCEAYINAYSSMFKIKSYVLRFSNVFGPYCFHKKGVINKLFNSYINDSNFTIYGDGTSTRDYIYVKDIASAILSCILDKGGKLKNIYHLSSNVETSLNALIKIFSKLSNKTVQIEYAPFRDGEVLRNFGDYNLAKNELGFEPNKDLESLIQKTFIWYKNFLRNE